MAETTENTITCVSNTIDTVGVNLLNYPKLTPAILPAGCAITEIEVQLRSATLIAPDGGQNITLGVLGVAGANYAFPVATINGTNWTGYTLPAHSAAAAAANLKAQASVGNITAGSLYVVIKYKPISTGDRKY